MLTSRIAADTKCLMPIRKITTNEQNRIGNLLIRH